MTSDQTFQYQGEELHIFAHAKRWKAYWASYVAKWIRGDVLEVGAGLGANTVLLQSAAVRTWHCLEPDAELAAQLNSAIAGLPACTASTGTIRSLENRQFDCILYLDVLEHIRQDREELAEASSLLRPEGHIVVLAPAHQYLFSSFDSSIGHYRRYNRKSLLACSPPECRLVAMVYLDCLGAFLSLANRFLLRQDIPTLEQILAWDRYIVPVSQALDPVFRYRIGKTILGVWIRKSARPGGANA